MVKNKGEQPTMDLRNKHGHMAGKSVLVDGILVKIDADGIARDVPAKAAEKLLKNAQEAWKDVKGVRVAPKVKEAAAEPTGAEEATEADSEVQPEEEPTAEDGEPEPESEAEGEETSEEDGEGWDYPTEDMPMSELREQARAFEVKAKGGISKKELVTLITEAMDAIGDDEGEE